MSSIEYINSVVLTTSTATVILSNIPQYYQDLILVGSNIKNSFSGTGSIQQYGLQFNSDSGSNYSDTNLGGNGSTASSARNSNVPGIFSIVARNSDTPSFHVWDIISYKDNNIFKTILESSMVPNVNVYNRVGLWRNTAPINTISVANVSPYTWLAGSIFTLWGVR